MRISPSHIETLKVLLKKRYGLDYSDEEAQAAGMAILRFVIVKKQRTEEMQGKRHDHANQNKPIIRG